MAHLVIDFYGRAFVAREHADTEDNSWLFAHTADLNDIIHRIRDIRYRRIVFCEGAAEAAVDRDGMYPGTYSTAVAYAKMCLPREDIRP